MTELELMAISGASIIVLSLFVVVFGLGYAAGKRVTNPKPVFGNKGFQPKAITGWLYNPTLNTWEYHVSSIIEREREGRS